MISRSLRSNEILRVAAGPYLLLTSLIIIFEGLLRELTEYFDFQGQLLGC